MYLLSSKLFQIHMYNHRALLLLLNWSQLDNRYTCCLHSNKILHCFHILHSWIVDWLQRSYRSHSWHHYLFHCFWRNTHIGRDIRCSKQFPKCSHILDNHQLHLNWECWNICCRLCSNPRNSQNYKSRISLRLMYPRCKDLDCSQSSKQSLNMYCKHMLNCLDPKSSRLGPCKHTVLMLMPLLSLSNLRKHSKLPWLKWSLRSRLNIGLGSLLLVGSSLSKLGKANCRSRVQYSKDKILSNSELKGMEVRTDFRWDNHIH